MIDIIGVNGDIQLLDTDVKRAENILSTQLGALEYAQEVGIDLSFFLDERFVYQNESFNAYIVEVLANSGINVTQVRSEINSLFEKLSVSVQGMQTGTALVR